MYALLDWLLHLPWGNPLFTYAAVWAVALCGMGYLGMLRRFPSTGGAVCITVTMLLLIIPPFLCIGMGYVVYQCITGSVLYRAAGIMLILLFIGFMASQVGA